MRNGDGQTVGHVGIGNSRKNVETLGEVMIRIERHLVEGARTGTAETGGGRAGPRNAEVVLSLRRNATLFVFIRYVKPV